LQGVCDGAGAVLLASEEACSKFNLKPLARLVGYSVVGVEPSIMGIGPAPAIQMLLEKTGKSLADIDLIEVRSTLKTAISESRINFLNVIRSTRLSVPKLWRAPRSWVLI
jgi:acetyl-CoA acetyltransferase